MKITVFGIANCDSVRKARKWLKENGYDHRFHDIRSDGLDAKQVSRWLKAAGPGALLNRRGQAWRALSDQERMQADGNDVTALLLKYPLLLKRPIAEIGKDCIVGFLPDEYRSRLR